jgi:MFS family permease
MEEKELSSAESLRLIQQMITVAKEERRENGAGWLIWGWLLFFASVASLVCEFTGFRHWVGWVWLGMLAVGLILYFAFYMLKCKNKAVRVKTYVEELVSKIEAGFFISLFAIVAGSMLSGGLYVFGYYYILYAFWMFIHGSAIKFRPLIVGAWINWFAAVGIFVVTKYLDDPLNFRFVMIISAFAILTGYLIPGYMLRSEHKKKSLQQDIGNGV